MVIEGTDGAGTTTQKDLLMQVLAEGWGQHVISVAEPGGTPVGDALRRIIKDASLERSPETNFDMFTASRRELARQIIEPALAGGTHVISDRNWFSSVAYQGFGEGGVVQSILERTQEALGKLFIPNLAIIVDVSVEVSETRMQGRNTSANDYFEQKGRLFFERVREGYLWIAHEFGFPVVDGSQSIETVHGDVMEHLGNFAVIHNST